MKIEFCSQALGTSIISSSLCADNYEAKNLLKTYQNSFSCNKGFQVERFNKCPAAIIIKFALKVDIDEIVLKPWIGSHCASSIKLYVYNSPRALYDQIEADEIKFLSSNAIITSRKIIRFHKPNQQLHPHHFNSEMKGRLDSVHAIKIVIHRMLQGSVPSIASLSILGTPSRTNDEKTNKDTFHQWMQLMKKDEFIEKEEKSLKRSHEEVSRSVEDVKMGTDDKIPELFTDSLMFTLMKNPVALPSGKRIDQATLERYLSSQELMGRSPCDPFTGIKFSETYRPVIDSKLKFDIDHWCLRKSSKIKLVQEDVNVSAKCRYLDKKQLELKCCKCQMYLPLSDSNRKYQMPCSHKLCTKCCDPTSHSFTCNLCNREFSRQELYRIHGI